MNSFKPGNWVRHIAFKSKHKCISIDDGEFDDKVSVTNSPSFDNEFMIDYELWQPKVGEWVVIADDITPDLYAVFQFNNHSKDRQILPFAFLQTLKDQS